MSRTAHSFKPAGYEYWSRRPFNKNGQTPGSFAKHRTHKAERREGKQAMKDTARFISGDRTAAVVAGVSRDGYDGLVARDDRDSFVTRTQE